MATESRSGPIVWAGIVAATCLLLAAFQKILWLVVPFLLALIAYYLLQPLMQRLLYRGMSRDGAATLVTLGFLAALAGAAIMATPWVATHALDWNASVERYLQGGVHLLDRTLRGLETEFGMLARARIADTFGVRLAQATDGMAAYLEPVAVGIAVWTPSLLLAPFLAFFFLKDGDRFKRFIGRAVPNAFFEKTLCLIHGVDRTARAYFQGLMKLTVLDTLTLALGLWIMGFPAPLALGFICAVLAWVPYVGSILGGLLVVLVAATDFPDAPSMAYWAVALFVVARLLDDFIYMPLTVGKSLRIHPLVTVLMIFVGGAVAGIPGLMLVLPVLGVMMVVGETLGEILTDSRLMARHRHARRLRREQASADLC